MEIKLRLAKIMYFFFAISFFISALITCGGLMTILLILWPLNKNAYRRLCSYLGYAMFSQAVCMLRYWATLELKLYVDREVYEKYLGKEHSLCILNHVGELDWIVMSALLDKLNLLRNAKAYIKNSIKYIPFVGWGFYCCEFIYLSRSFEQDRITLKKSAQDLSEFKEPVTILLYPEGTRFSHKKHEEAIRFARERGFKEMQHHLMPRTKGFTTSVPFMKGKIPAIYDVEVAFEGVEPTIANIIKAQRFIVHMHLKRIPMDQVPSSEVEQEQYLRDMFYSKDALMESFVKTGDFFQMNNLPNLEPIKIEPTITSLYNLLFWFVISLSPIIYILFRLLINAQFFYFSLIVICIASGFRVLAKSIDNMVVIDAKNKVGDMANGFEIIKSN